MNAAVRRIAFSALFLLLGAYGYFTLSGPQGIPALMEKRREIRRLEEENANIIRENEMKRERIRKLTQSTSEQDLEIRKKLKLLHENETEFILPSQAPVSPAPASGR
jgi:cell division protein FtsB